MGYTKLFELLKDEPKLTSLISNLSSGYIEVPYIISETLKLLEDDSIFYGMISDKNKRSLCIMLDNYMVDCWMQYIEDLKLDKLLKFGKVEIYKIEAADGIRYATKNEVANGVRGLIGEYTYVAGEDAYKKMCLLEWSFYGKSYFYRQAGYNLSYDNNGKITTTFYEMITQAAYGIKEMFDWMTVSSNLEKSLNSMKKLQKKHGYQYANYAKDEVTEDITIKQLVYNIVKVFPRNSNNHEYRKALALALKNYKNKVTLTPLEVSQLREIYEKHALDVNRNGQSLEENKELRVKCEKVLSERYSGKIAQDDFAYTIIESLKKINYSKCSPKQLDIINRAYYILFGNDIVDNKEPVIDNTEIISEEDIDISLADMSNELFGEEVYDD